MKTDEFLLFYFLVHFLGFDRAQNTMCVYSELKN